MFNYELNMKGRNKKEEKKKKKDGKQNMVNESSWFNPLQFPYIAEWNRQLGQIHHSEMFPLKYSPFADTEKNLSAVTAIKDGEAGTASPNREFPTLFWLL